MERGKQGATEYLGFEHGLPELWAASIVVGAYARFLGAKTRPDNPAIGVLSSAAKSLEEAFEFLRGEGSKNDRARHIQLTPAQIEWAITANYVYSRRPQALEPYMADLSQREIAKFLLAPPIVEDKRP